MSSKISQLSFEVLSLTFLFSFYRFIDLVGIYGEPKGNLLSLVEGHQGGLTHLLFSQDGHRLYSGGRKVIIGIFLAKTGHCFLCMSRTSSMDSLL